MGPFYFLHVNWGKSTFQQPIGQPKEKNIKNKVFCGTRPLSIPNFQIKKGPLVNMIGRKGLHIPVPTYPLRAPKVRC